MTVASAGLVLAAAVWWAYFLIPSRLVLERWPRRIFRWRYAHLPMFGAIAAVGAGLRVAAHAVEDEGIPVMLVAWSLVVPVAVVVLTVFLTWSVLLRSYDASHIPLLLLSLVPLAAAVVVALFASAAPPESAESMRVPALVAVIVLVALAGVVEVVGHEAVGYRHTVRALSAPDVEEPPR